MNKGNLMNNTKTRRKGSMLQDSLSKIKYLFLLAILLVLPMQALAGGGPVIPVIDQTDTGVNRLVAFFDTRGRDTLIQVTNTSSNKVTIHVQVWDVASPFTTCEECNFDDMLTGFDTHVYDIENMVTNMDGDSVCDQLTEPTYGFMVISSGFAEGDPFSLIGMFRIIDEAGYEYRANAAGTEDFESDSADPLAVNFSDANGHILSDLVGITYLSLGSFEVHASPNVRATFGAPGNTILIWDEDEDDESCSPTTFSCAVAQMDKGIDNRLPNSLGQQNRVCPTDILNDNIAGWLEMPFTGFSCFDTVCNSEIAEDQYFVGFIGLNNGDGTGSMDSWWEVGLDRSERGLIGDLPLSSQ